MTKEIKEKKEEGNIRKSFFRLIADALFNNVPYTAGCLFLFGKCSAEL